MNEDNLKLINIALKERIGVIVSSYESDMATLRAEASMMIEALTKQNSDLNQEVKNLKAKLGEDDVAVPEEK